MIPLEAIRVFKRTKNGHPNDTRSVTRWVVVVVVNGYSCLELSKVSKYIIDYNEIWNQQTYNSSDVYAL